MARAGGRRPSSRQGALAALLDRELPGHSQWHDLDAADREVVIETAQSTTVTENRARILRGEHDLADTVRSVLSPRGLLR